MRKTQQDKPAVPKTRRQDKPRFIVTREYNGSQSMRAAFEQAIESQACGQGGGNVHLLPVQTVHAVSNSDIADVVTREEDFDIAASFNVVPAQP